MKKGQFVKCIETEGTDYLTVGKRYGVYSGQGDKNMFGGINSKHSFEIIDDEGDVIFQNVLDGLHGKFEVSNEA